MLQKACAAERTCYTCAAVQPLCLCLSCDNSSDLLNTSDKGLPRPTDDHLEINTEFRSRQWLRVDRKQPCTGTQPFLYDLPSSLRADVLKHDPVEV